VRRAVEWRTPYALDKLCVLVIDDCEPIRELVRGMLRSYGVRDVCTAESGAEGLAMLKSREPDLAICDIGMQLMDGLTFVRAVRDPAKCEDPHVPIIVVSAHSDEKMVEEARESGITEYLVKPITAEALLSRVHQALARPRSYDYGDDPIDPVDAGAARRPDG